MSAAAKKVADALLKIGMQSHPRDSRLAYITPAQEHQLEAQDGSKGVPDPVTGIMHHDGEDGTNSENSFDDGSMAASMGQNTDGSWGGLSSEDFGHAAGIGDGAQFGDPGSWTGNFDDVMSSARDAQDAYNATHNNTYQNTDEKGQELADTTASGKSGPNADVDAVNNEYTSIYGAPDTNASAINQSFADFMNEVNSTGYAGRGLGTLYDAYQGGMKGAALGPAGMLAGGLLGGFTGKNGDRGEALGRSSVENSLLNGTWNGKSGPADNTGNGMDAEYTTQADDGGGPSDPAPGALTDAAGGHVWSSLYHNYIPASASALSTVQSSAAPAWKTLGSDVQAQDMAGGQPYDAVDFLERQKKEAAVRQALMETSAKQTQKIPSLDDYLAGKY